MKITIPSGEYSVTEINISRGLTGFPVLSFELGYPGHAVPSAPFETTAVPLDALSLSDGDHVFDDEGIRVYGKDAQKELEDEEADAPISESALDVSRRKFDVGDDVGDSDGVSVEGDIPYFEESHGSGSEPGDILNEIDD